MILLALTARPITRPLRRLAETVGLIARGIYDVPVQGTDREDEVGAIARAVAILNDSVRERDELRANILVQNAILERREGELRTQNRLFDAALNNMSHGLCMFDRERRLIVSNRRYEEIFGFEHGDVLPGTTWEELHALEKVVAETPDGDDHGVNDPGFDGPGIGRTTSNVRLHDGRTILSTRQPLVGGGWVVIYEDVTERQRAREKLVHMARHDVLTGLPNRITLREHLSRQLARQRLEGGTFAVICLDLDEFKTVNDTFGHPAGDRLLCEVTRRLLACVDEVEMVARLGGDEFAIVTRLAPTTEMIALRCEMLIKAIGEPHAMDDHEAVVGVSIGIAVAPTDGRDPDTLLKQADLALYRAKFEGRNTYRFFETGMEEAVKARHDLITDLRSALENGELEAYFQPQVDLATGVISGFEALMRWHHPRRGMVPPVEFIPIAEETGLIVQMGEWILREATAVAATWPSPVKVAVNISARQLQRPGFVMTVTSALAASGLPAHRLELEVTESVVLQDDDHTRNSLTSLKDLGVKIAMDDFGTGYSSLSCLRSFPFDKIKIDQSFVRAMPTSEEARSIVTAIIGLAQSLKVATTAEGVETEDLFELLRGSGCTEGQGYHIGRPEPASHAAALIARFSAPPRLRALN
nr:EAL domain-containing protein [Chthonobacter albigriseus]